MRVCSSLPSNKQHSLADLKPSLPAAIQVVLTNTGHWHWLNLSPL